MIQKSS
jgi:WD40 repeat protein